ncbi:RagB/SusD domain protein [Aquipluma nitroreducens]|uniref:RagB/SusD domain protein n=1 Tax=Aquipluma nitroreducens TaxID=2010828 RepID=A0A5K7S572_9BACT|nr:RagB/SusD family nutrient uptake outer membrane protein [Aquipluma nitroreducens]BBE16676.1 RagB/SusD domain protein [Aquipluma nitroreducens]
MKTYNSIFFILTFATGIFLSGCKNEFLELAPQSQLSVESYYKTAEQIEFAVNGAYSTLQSNNMYQNWYVLSEIPSDNTTNNLSGSVTDQDEFDKFYIRTTNPFTANFWNESYKGINKCNMVLSKIDGVTMDASRKDQLTKEVKFLRGLMYFNLVRIFGGVPLVTSTVQITDAYTIARSTQDETYAQIIKDLTDAETLPASYTGNDVGRATSGTVKALLGTVYMTMKDYAKGETKLAEVVSSGKYSLLENTAGSLNITGYEKVFDPTNHNNKESIFDVQFKKGGFGEGSGFANNFAPENSGTSVVAVGSTGGNNIPTEDMNNAYEAGDLRKDYSMASSYIDNKTGKTISIRHVKKYRDVPYQSGDANIDYPVIRYADVLLMYAEALNENGKTAEACTMLNKVRRRGFGYQSTETSPVDISTADKVVFRDKVFQERRVELAFEGQRWFDLIRTGRAVEVMKSKGFKINETQLICPIPQKQIDINPEVMIQNTYRID